jgi:hypothetical protein
MENIDVTASQDGIPGNLILVRVLLKETYFISLLSPAWPRVITRQ